MRLPMNEGGRRKISSGLLREIQEGGGSVYLRSPPDRWPSDETGFRALFERGPRCDYDRLVCQGGAFRWRTVSEAQCESPK